MGQTFGDMGEIFGHFGWTKECLTDRDLAEAVQEAIPESHVDILPHGTRSMVTFCYHSQ